jgi:hypothetical protein
MSALRRCPGCGHRRILLEHRGGGVRSGVPSGTPERLCIDCLGAPQGRLFTSTATLDDLGAERVDVLVERHHDDAGIPAPCCSCDRPLGDSDGGCIRCGKSVAA